MDRSLDIVFQMATGHFLSRMVYVVAEHRIADHLGNGPRTSIELAAATGLHEPSLYRLLRTLAAFGLFTESSPRQFALTESGEVLRTEHRSGARDMVLLRAGQRAWTTWGMISEVIATGRSGSDLAFGMTLFEYLEAHPEEAASFDRAMLTYQGDEAAAAAKAYDFSRYRTVVDVGGGIGALLAAILEAYPAITATLLERTQVLGRARAHLTQRGFIDRCELMAGDFFEGVPGGQDLYLLSHVIHNWDEESCLKILDQCKRAMRQESRLLIIEYVIPPGDAFHPGKMMDMVMLVNLGGTERTREEYDELLQRAGLRLSQVIPTSSPASVIEVVRS